MGFISNHRMESPPPFILPWSVSNPNVSLEKGKWGWVAGRKHDSLFGGLEE